MRKALEPDFLSVVVSKQDILLGNTQPTIDVLRTLTRSPEKALKWQERVDIVFVGYTDTQWELFEIPVTNGPGSRLFSSPKLPQPAGSSRLTAMRMFELRFL
ncbi:MAG: hypothetical protein WCA45_15625 [Thiobacillaceae bacterium]